MAKLSIGSRVALTRDATYGDATRAALRGSILAIKEHSRDFVLAAVRWDHQTGTHDVNIRNLCTTRSVAFIESAASIHPLI